MIEDDTLKRAAARITLTTSTSMEWCLNQPIEDFLDFCKILFEEHEKMKPKGGKGNGQ